MKDIKEVKPEYPSDELNKHQFGDQVLGMFKTVSVVPTRTPKNWFDQIVLYVNGSVIKLYVFDTTNFVWRPIWMGDLVGTGHTTVSQSTSQITINST